MSLDLILDTDIPLKSIGQKIFDYKLIQMQGKWYFEVNINYDVTHKAVVDYTNQAVPVFIPADFKIFSVLGFHESCEFMLNKGFFFPRHQTILLF
ncbi:MAG: hypothetical protein AB8B68_01450 [Rickettsiaceae bacterium]